MCLSRLPRPHALPLSLANLDMRLRLRLLLSALCPPPCGVGYACGGWYGCAACCGCCPDPYVS